MALYWVYATKRVATAPSLTILVMLPHVPSNGTPPFSIFDFLIFLSLEHGGRGVSSGLDANYPLHTNCWPEAPLGGEGGSG